MALIESTLPNVRYDELSKSEQGVTSKQFDVIENNVHIASFVQTTDHVYELRQINGDPILKPGTGRPYTVANPPTVSYFDLILTEAKNELRPFTLSRQKATRLNLKASRLIELRKKQSIDAMYVVVHHIATGGPISSKLLAEAQRIVNHVQNRT